MLLEAVLLPKKSYQTWFNLTPKILSSSLERRLRVIALTLLLLLMKVKDHEERRNAK